MRTALLSKPLRVKLWPVPRTPALDEVVDRFVGHHMMKGYTVSVIRDDAQQSATAILPAEGGR